MNKPVLSGGTKRIVLKHTTGALAGLHRIMGTTDQLQPDFMPPSYVTEVDFIDHKAPGCLVKVTNRFILYQELPPIDHPTTAHGATPQPQP